MIQTLTDALQERGYDSLTPVQEAVTDPGLNTADLLVSAQTGSGKTVGFGLAIAPTLLEDAAQFGPAAAPLALIIAPTRELALQVQRELGWLFAKAGATVTSCVGGMDSRTERRALERGAHVVVATPGRLCDHINRGNIDLSAVRAVVLDEADEMLDMGFREELETILSETPQDRRTLMFSATVPAAIAKLAERYQRDVQRISVAGPARQHADIAYRALLTHPRDIDNAIINVLRYYEAQNAIIFCNTRAAVARMTARLTNRRFPVVALSGELTQSERSNALQALRDGRARVCVATDVAARGIDLPDLALVIHADLPSNADTLLHRSGRTGRAGRKGVSALIVPPKQRAKANRLLGWAKLSADWGTPPSAAEVYAEDETRMLEDPAWNAPVPDAQQSLVTSLADRFTPEQLAAAFVSLAQSQRAAPEELGDPDARDTAPRQAFGPSVWFSLNQGRNAGAEPRRILPMICRPSDLTKDDIGAIRIQSEQSFVEVRADRADALNGIALEEGLTLTRLDAPPSFETAPRGKPPQPKPYKPAAAPKGKRPPKSHKTERSPMKPGARPQPKSSATGPEGATAGAPKSKGRAKAVWTEPRRQAADAATRDASAGADPAGHKQAGQKKPEGKKPRAKPAGTPDASRKRAADPSKRFVPPHKRGKPATNARRSGKGPNATPRRKG
ncbi:DEAD/DEAH box helicase [uncultured Roseobacter sp.]|uniref:DEAD/DEAH box helicase n=1 Tax=uncultured Roseobacter sp. TaxID=114847 RepID=UPI0026312FE7|nr:DEAD/DEAH box helicase [uncultured Roseobacter sp.]